MHLDLLFSPLEVSRISDLENKTAVIIDVLRASSTMVYAFNAYDNDNPEVLKGVKQIIPAKNIKAAFKKFEEVDKKEFLLAGEKNGFPPEGFHCGNSPEDFKIKNISGKSLVMATTNGTKTLNLLTGCKAVFIGSFLNAFAVARKCIEHKRDVVIACAGRESVSGIEDITCGGLIASYIRDLSRETAVKYELSDAAITAIRTYNSYDNIFNILKESFHGRYLIQVGLEKDLYSCSKKNKFNIVPYYKDGKILPEVLKQVIFCSLNE